MEQNIVTKLILPLALFIVMLGMGLSLVPGDFRRVLEKPRAVVVGLTGQLLLLPLIALGTIQVFNLPPEFAVGLMVLAFSPGGSTSNAITYLVRGDLALSITLTAVTSMITPLTIPLATAWAMHRYLGEAATVQLPLGQTIALLVAITLVPVSLGMFVRNKSQTLAERAERPVRLFSLFTLFLIIGGLVLKERASLFEWLAQTGGAALMLNVGSMAVGFAIANIARLDRSQAMTISIEVGIQNGTTALLVTGTLLGSATMSIPPAIYSLVMYVSAALLGVLVAMGRRRRERAAVGVVG